MSYLPNIVRVHSQLCKFITDILYEGGIVLRHVCLIDNLHLQKLGDVDEGGEDDDGEEVIHHPGAEPSSHNAVSVVERVTDCRVPEVL